MSRIRADFAGFATAEQAFGLALEVFESSLSELEQRLEADLAAWTGDAARAYQVFHDTWRAAARDLARQLADLHRALGVAHHNFRSAKAASLRMWTAA